MRLFLKIYLSGRLFEPNFESTLTRQTMSANQAIEKLNVLKRIIERLNSEMVIMISAAAEIEIIIKKNEAGISKYPLLESKVNSLIENYKNLIK